MSKLRFACFIAGLLVACGSSDPDQKGQTGSVSEARHGLPADAKASSLTEEQRLAICADMLRRIEENMGEPERECTAMFIQSRKDTTPDVAACEASVQKCVQNGLPRHGDDARRIKLCDDLIPPLIRSDCETTVGDFDACTTEKLVAHTKNLQAVSCKDPGSWKRLKTGEVAPACNKVRGTSCMTFNPSSF
jgi:hypothetical protein